MSPLEQILRATAADLDWPATPPIAEAIERSLDRAPARSSDRSARIRIGRPLAIAFAALLLMAATAAAIPGVREPVLDWLGLRSVHVERVPRPLPEVPGAKLALGTHLSLDAARRRLGFTPVLAPGLGTPVAWYDSTPPGGELTLVYRKGELLLAQVEGGLKREFVFKFLQPGTGAQGFRIDGQRALWIHGLHQYAYADRHGAIRPDSIHTAGDVLLWRRGKLLLRLEGARSKAEAIRIARSLREAP